MWHKPSGDIHPLWILCSKTQLALYSRIRYFWCGWSCWGWCLPPTGAVILFVNLWPFTRSCTLTTSLRVCFAWIAIFSVFTDRWQSLHHRHSDGRIRWVYFGFRGHCSQASWLPRLQTGCSYWSPIFHCIPGFSSKVRFCNLCCRVLNEVMGMALLVVSGAIKMHYKEYFFSKQSSCQSRRDSSYPWSQWWGRKCKIYLKFIAVLYFKNDLDYSRIQFFFLEVLKCSGHFGEYCQHEPCLKHMWKNSSPIGPHSLWCHERAPRSIKGCLLNTPPNLVVFRSCLFDAVSVKDQGRVPWSCISWLAR